MSTVKKETVLNAPTNKGISKHEGQNLFSTIDGGQLKSHKFTDLPKTCFNTSNMHV